MSHQQKTSVSTTVMQDQIILITQNANQNPVHVWLSDTWKAIDTLLLRSNHLVAAYMLEQISDQLADHPAPPARLLKVLVDFMRLDEAEDVANHLLQRFPSNTDVLCAIAHFHQIDGRPELAASRIEKVLQLDPRNTMALKMMIEICSSTGDDLRTAEYINRALETDPENPNIVFSVARFQKSTAKPEFVEQITRLTESNKFEGKLQALLHYSMAWLKVTDIDSHFAHLHKANAIACLLHIWNREATEAARLKNTSFFCNCDFQQLQHHGDQNFHPIFIAAMPRSGTTLLEQMIGGHSQAFCVGERAAFNIALSTTLNTGHNLATAQTIDAVTDFPGAIQQAIENYRDSRQITRAAGKRVIDKSIGNWNVLGMILLAFPNAKIVHIRRHPLDIIYSCYQQPFDSGHFYSNDLLSLAQMYRIYDDQMQEWKQLFPDSIYTLHYENLVTNQESELKQLLEFCGLDWEEQCLDYRSHMGSITTASDQQVRRPLHSNAIAKWELAKQHLMPAIKELGDLAAHTPPATVI